MLQMRFVFMLILVSWACHLSAATVVVFDLSPSPGAVGNRVVALQSPQDDVVALLDRFALGAVVKDDQAKLQKMMHDLAAESVHRWITSTGDAIVIYAVFDANQQGEPRVGVKEEERATEFESTFSSLLRVVGKLAGVPFGGDPTPSSWRATRTEYVLTRLRSTVEIAATSQITVGDGASVASSIRALAGPKEHFFISADLPVNKASELSYNSETDLVTSREAPSTFYAGLSYMLGDLLTPERAPTESLVLKGLVKISKRPLESYGVALGYRFGRIDRWGVELDAFSPFVGYIWTEEPRSDQPEKTRHKGTVRYGISVNIDTALGWMK